MTKKTTARGKKKTPMDWLYDGHLFSELKITRADGSVDKQPPMEHGDIMEIVYPRKRKSKKNLQVEQ
jgi:hypothetical protein